MAHSILLPVSLSVTHCVCHPAILLGHMRMSVADIRQALTQMDETILTPELLKQMLAYAPDSNEVQNRSCLSNFYVQFICVQEHGKYNISKYAS